MLLRLNSHMRILPSGSTDYFSSLLFNFGSTLLSPLLDRGHREQVVFLLPHNRPTILFLPIVWHIIYQASNLDIQNIIMSSNFSSIICFFHNFACIQLQTSVPPRSNKYILFKINILLQSTDAR